MSTATELTRISNAKAAIRTSIENKGVTVPAADLIDTYSQYIDAISTATPTQTKSVTIDSNTVTTIRPDTGYDLSEVTVTTAVPGGASDIQTIGQQYINLAEGQGTVIDLSSQTHTGTFFNLTDCTSLTLPVGVTTLESYSFSFRPSRNGCSVTIPSTVTLISSYAFGRITDPQEDTHYYYFNVSFNPRSSTDSLTVYSHAFGETKITSLTFPANTTFKFDYNTSHNNEMFYHCNITSIDLSACTNLTTIGQQFFRESYRLRTVVLPETITTISDFAFYGCNSLSSPLIIPASVTTLGNYSCYIPGGELHFRSTTPATIGSYTFGFGASTAPNVYVPYSSDHSVLATYQSAWTDLNSWGKLFEEAAPTP